MIKKSCNLISKSFFVEMNVFVDSYTVPTIQLLFLEYCHISYIYNIEILYFISLSQQ